MSSAVTPSCPTDEQWATLLERQLSSQELDALHAHAARCADCEVRMASLARLLHASHGEGTPAADPESADALEWMLRSTLEQWVPPATFGTFTLERRLGQGAMGVVYLAYDRELERPVALKFIAAPQPEDRALRRFKTEGLAVARLQHPHVVTLFGVGEVEGHPYLVSEYLEGQSLARAAPRMPWRQVLHLGLRLARGLTAAHEKQVLHRDIKPSNIFLTRDGGVKLLDFGLAELIGPERDPASGPARAGTLHYMAPELQRGPASERSDLYALGVVLYELCTGERDMPPEARLGRPLATRVPDIDRDFAALLERCVHPDPTQRLASAQLLAEALEWLEPPRAPLLRGDPYRGLEPFEAEHQALFFGRDAQIRDVLGRLREHSLVLVAGDSGVGKSSLCRAGVLPRAEHAGLSDGRDFTVLRLEPGPRPLDTLAAALAPLLGRDEPALREALARAPVEEAQALRAAWRDRRGLLIFVDQLEELLTQADPLQTEAFARLLGALALPSPELRVLLAVRGDFLTRLGALPGLGEHVERALYLLRPLHPAQLRDAIHKPARQRGVVFESDALVDALVTATGQHAGGLPLLQFTLAELWERRDVARGVIPQAALDALGGMAGALSRHADGVLHALPPPEQQAARQLLGQLVNPDNTRRERTADELGGLTAGAPGALRALVDGRLLHVRVADGRPVYEIAHEALITHWSTLRDWLDEHKGRRALRHRLELAGAEWENSKHNEELLWRERQLDEARALDVAALGAREQAFLRTSRRVLLAHKQRRWLGVLLTVLLGVGVFGGLRWKQYLDTWREVDAQVEAVRQVLVAQRADTAKALADRDALLARFDQRQDLQDGLDPAQRGERARAHWFKADEDWGPLERRLEHLRAEYDKAERALGRALEFGPGHEGARDLRVELLREHLLLAEQLHVPHGDLRERFELLAGGTPLADWLGRPARLELEPLPPDVQVELMRPVWDETHHGRLERVPLRGASVELPPGPYVLRFLRGDQLLQQQTLRLARDSVTRSAGLPTAPVPEGYLAIAPGSCFLSGTDERDVTRQFMHSAPLHEVCLEQGYLIARTEVTLAQWMDYLDAEGPQAPGWLALQEEKKNSYSGVAFTLRKAPQTGWRFQMTLPSARTPGGTDTLTAQRGAPIVYPARNQGEVDWERFPLADVNPGDLSGLLAWLDRTGRLPGARLCEEVEWTLAARGPDARGYPSGAMPAATEANYDVTYGRDPAAFGPDPVCEHPASDSPLGACDMAGNAFELVHSSTWDMGEYVLRGGSWMHETMGMLVANRTTEWREAFIGVRLCAPFPPPPPSAQARQEP